MTADCGGEHALADESGVGRFVSAASTTKEGNVMGASGGKVLDKDDLLLGVEGEVWVGVDEALETVPDEGGWVCDEVLVVV